MSHSHPSKANHGRLFGVTFALIGVLVAFCSAMVSSARNEFMRAMIQQTQAHSDFTGASTKMRLAFLELEKQYARLAGHRDPEGGWSPVPRFIELSGDYSRERGLAKDWDDSFKPVVAAHFDASESYETAQLIAEVAIVIASLAVLLSSRAAWLASLVVSAVSLLQLGYAYVHTTLEVNRATVRIHQAEAAYDELRHSHSAAHQDQDVIDRLDPDGSIRAKNPAAASKAAGE